MAITATDESKLKDLFKQVSDVFAPDTQPGTTPPNVPPAERPLGASEDGWLLKFNEPFTASALDKARWRFGDIDKADGYQRDFDGTSTAFYIPQQVSFRDGVCVLQAVKRVTKVEIVGDTDKRKNTFVRGANEDTYFSTWLLARNLLHQSGLITTAPDIYGLTSPTWQKSPATYDFKYGWFEARVKLPKGKGLWPAMWLKRSDKANSQEIDVFELVDPTAERLAFHLHGGNNGSTPWDWTTDEGKGRKFYEPGKGSLADDFHVFAVDWQPGWVRWYVDGKLVQECNDKARVPDGAMYLLFNFAVSGSWPGNPDATTPFPAELLIDWVKVWQR